MQRKKTAEEKIKPSYSAIAVTQAVVNCSKFSQWSHLVDPVSAKIMEHFVKTAIPKLSFGRDKVTLKIMGASPHSVQRSLYKKFGGIVAYPQHMALRKLFIETQVRTAIAGGIKQVLVVGGGYDALTLRLHKEYPNVQFIEADRGPTRTIKLQALQTLGNVLPEFKELGNNLHYLECDLAKENWPEVLQNQSYFSNKEDSVVIAEGVTPYLTLKDVNRLFAQLRDEIMTDNSQFLVGIAGRLENFGSVVTDILLKESNESYQFLLQLEKIPRYCADSGFNISARALSSDMQLLTGNKHMSDQEYVRKLPPEHYFVLTKPTGWRQENTATHVLAWKKIEDIPVAHVNVPPKHEHKKSCHK